MNDILILGNKVFTQKGELVNITILSDEDIAKADLSYGSRVYQGAIGKVSEDSFTFITDNEEIVVKYTPGQMINTDYNTKSSSKSAFQELAGRRLELVTSRDMVFVAFKFYNTPSQAN